MACNSNEVWKENRLTEDMDGNAKFSALMILASWIGMDDSKLIPHTFSGFVLHLLSKQLSFSAFSFHAGMLGNIFEIIIVFKQAIILGAVQKEINRGILVALVFHLP